MSSAEQIAGYAHRAGWSGTDLPVAVAVALAESHGNDNARGDVGLENSTWGPSVGLWQIRSLNAEKGHGTTRDELANSDPQTNANHAYAIWKQSGWGPWTTHNTGAYLLYMPIATNAVSLYYATNPATVGADVVGATGSAVGSAADAVGSVMNPMQAALSIAETPIKVLKWLTDPGTITRIAKVVVGVGLVYAAFAVIIRPVAEPIVKGAAKAGEVAAVA